jgi:hypothetical protein
MNKIVFCQNIKKTYDIHCNDFVKGELVEVELKLIGLFIGLSGILYLKNNKNILLEFLFQAGYTSFLMATKLSNAYTKVKNYFVSSVSSSNSTDQKCKSYIYDEVKVIKNGVRYASFETMTTFKESGCLGNPNDYYDLEEIVDESNSSTSSSSCASSCASSTSSFDSDTSSSSLCSSPSPSSRSSHESSEPLLLMEKNESNHTIEFRTFDFIMHTNYMYPDTEISRTNYTGIYRTFVEDDYHATTYENSNAEMIICNLEIDGEDGDDNEEYEIDLSCPYNFNVVGNLILDEKFVYWYILRKYNYSIEPSVNYKITCITKDIKTFQLDRSCGLRVHPNEYEQVASSQF